MMVRESRNNTIPMFRRKGPVLFKNIGKKVDILPPVKFNVSLNILATMRENDRTIKQYPIIEMVTMESFAMVSDKRRINEPTVTNEVVNILNQFS